MGFLVTGLNFKTAPIEIREKISFDDTRIRDGLIHLKSYTGIRECVILSTCNRVEMYIFADQIDLAGLGNHLASFHNAGLPLEPYLVHLSGKEAIRHACRVAAGLDSQVLGEPQIFGQFKDALRVALDCNAAEKTMEHLFGRIFSVVKKVRTKTRIGEAPLSISYTAVKLARKTYPDLSAATALVIGAGEMGHLTLRNLVTCGVRRLYVTNRTFQRAVETAEQFSGIPIMFHELSEYIPKVDIVISSVAAQQFVLDPSHFQQTPNGRERPCILIDISVPRSIDPSVGALRCVQLYNIDDLQNVATSHADERRKEAVHAEEIIEDHIEDILKFLSATDLEPTVSAIRAEAERIRLTLVDEAVQGTPVGVGNQDQLNVITKSLVDRVLDESERRFKEFITSCR